MYKNKKTKWLDRALMKEQQKLKGLMLLFFLIPVIFYLLIDNSKGCLFVMCSFFTIGFIANSVESFFLFYFLRKTIFTFYLFFVLSFVLFLYFNYLAHVSYFFEVLTLFEILFLVILSVSAFVLGWSYSSLLFSSLRKVQLSLFALSKIAIS